MIGIVNKLDEWFAEWVEENYGASPTPFLKSFGFCELANRTNQTTTQPIPMTVNGTQKRDQVSLDDRYQVVTWYRLPGRVTMGNDIEGNDYAFGFQSNPVQKATILWIVASRVEVDEEFIFKLLQDIPYFLKVDGYSVSSIDRSTLTLDADHEAVYRTELGNTVYEKHRFTWNINAISVQLSYIVNPDCVYPEVCCEDSYLTESEDCIITESEDCLTEE